MNDVFFLTVLLYIAINCHNVEYEHNSLYGGTVQSCYNTNCYNTNLDITLSCLWLPNILLQKFTKEL